MALPKLGAFRPRNCHWFRYPIRHEYQTAQQKPGKYILDRIVYAFCFLQYKLNHYFCFCFSFLFFNRSLNVFLFSLRLMKGTYLLKLPGFSRAKVPEHWYFDWIIFRKDSIDLSCLKPSVVFCWTNVVHKQTPQVIKKLEWNSSTFGPNQSSILRMSKCFSHCSLSTVRGVMTLK